MSQLLAPLDDWLLDVRPGTTIRAGVAFLDDPVPLFVMAGLMLLNLADDLLTDEPVPDVLQRRIFSAVGDKMDLRELMSIECCCDYSRYFDRTILIARIGEHAVVSYGTTEDDEPYLAVAVGDEEKLLRILAEDPEVLPSLTMIDGFVDRVVLRDARISPPAAARLASHVTGTTVASHLVLC